MKKIAVRNLRLCTKDCLCLYVCPVGATDTENSIIDTGKCTGCGVCAEACPSKAISMVPVDYPPQQKKAEAVVAAANALAQAKGTGGTGRDSGCKDHGKGRPAPSFQGHCQIQPPGGGGYP